MVTPVASVEPTATASAAIPAPPPANGSKAGPQDAGQAKGKAGVTSPAVQGRWIDRYFGLVWLLLVLALVGGIAAGVYQYRHRLKVDFYRFWLPVRDYVTSAWSRIRAKVRGWLGWDAGPDPGLVDPDPFPPPGGGDPSGPPDPGSGTAGPPPAGSGSAPAPPGPPGTAAAPPGSGAAGTTAGPPPDSPLWSPAAKAKTMPGFAPPGAEPTQPFPFGFDPQRQMGVFDPPKAHAGKEPKKSVVVNMGGRPTGPDEATDLIGFPGGPPPPAPPDLDDPAQLDDPGGAPDRQSAPDVSGVGR